MTPFFITLHLDPNGGSVSEESVDIKAGGSYGLLPSAHRDGYIFAGWFTDPEKGEQIISSDTLISEEEHTLYAHWIKKKADKHSRYSRQKVQKKVIVTLVAMTAVLAVAWAVVHHIVGITTYEDVDGTKYKIQKKDGVYVVCDKDGYTLDLTTDGYYITDASTLLEVDQETGEVEQYAIVDTEGNEVVGSNRRILIFPHTAKASIQSITVNNDHGSYTFYRDSNNDFQIKGFEGTAYNPELFSSLVVSTGYTLSMQKLAEPRKDENGKFTEYGLVSEERVDEEGNTYTYTPVTYSLTDPHLQFRIEKKDDKYYLYSVGAQKYVSGNGNYEDNASTVLKMENVGGAYPWKLILGSNGMNSQDGGQTDSGIVINSWTTTDAGNCYQIVEAGEKVDVGIEDSEFTIQDSEFIYDLQGRRVANPTKGIYIVGGKKLVIK